MKDTIFYKGLILSYYPEFQKRTALFANYLINEKKNLLGRETVHAQSACNPMSKKKALIKALLAGSQHMKPLSKTSNLPHGWL